LLHASNYIDSFIRCPGESYKMNIQAGACVQSVHHQHAHMISDSHTSIDEVPVKVRTSLHQAFSQVVDVINLLFHTRCTV